MKFCKRSCFALSIGTLGLLGCGGADWDQSAQDLEPAEKAAELRAPTKSFLTLGDSIPFGFSPLVATPHIPSSYVGYPEVLAASNYQVTNPSCPGETSGSFLSVAAPDNGCRGFKSAYSLHADYATTQVSYVVGALKKTNFDFITLNIGANDLFLLQKKCNNDAACIQAGLPGVIQAYSQNLAAGYELLKKAVHKEKFIGVTTYAPNYSDQQVVGALSALNAALVSFTNQIGGKVADGFGAFANEAGPSGDSCAADLLIRLPDGTCDIHPSQHGREVLAATVLSVAN